MRRTLTLLMLLMFSVQSFAAKIRESEFSVTADIADSVFTSLDANQNAVHVKLPKDTTGVVEQKLPLGKNGAFVYKVRIKNIGAGSDTQAQAGDEVWIPYYPKASNQAFEFTDKKGRVLNAPKNGHNARTLRDVTVAGSDQSAPKTNKSSDAASDCNSVLDGANSSMVKEQLACLKNDQKKSKKQIAAAKAKKASTELDEINSTDPVYLEMLSYIDSVVPKQHKMNEQIAYYTLKYARELNIPIVVMLAMEKAESSFKAKRCSPKGACGLLQLMPGTAAKWADSKHDAHMNRSDIESNAKWAAHEIRDMMDLKVIKTTSTGKNGKTSARYSYVMGSKADHIPSDAEVVIDQPSLNEMLIAYNGGPGALPVAVKRNKPYRESKRYIIAVHKNIDEYTKMFADNHQSLRTPVID